MEGNEWADVCLGLEHNPSSIYGRIRALRGTGSARMNKAIQDSGDMWERPIITGENTQRGAGGQIPQHVFGPLCVSSGPEALGYGPPGGPWRVVVELMEYTL